MPEDVTEEMLDNVIDDFVSNKVYDQGPKGSTCHQCRQKTRYGFNFYVSYSCRHLVINMICPEYNKLWYSFKNSFLKIKSS